MLNIAILRFRRGLLLLAVIAAWLNAVLPIVRHLDAGWRSDGFAWICTTEGIKSQPLDAEGSPDPTRKMLSHGCQVCLGIQPVVLDQHGTPPVFGLPADHPPSFHEAVFARSGESFWQPSQPRPPPLDA